MSAGLLCYMRGGLVGAMVVWWKQCDAELLEYVWVLGVGSRAWMDLVCGGVARGV